MFTELFRERLSAIQSRWVIPAWLVLLFTILLRIWDTLHDLHTAVWLWESGPNWWKKASQILVSIPHTTLLWMFVASLVWLAVLAFFPKKKGVTTKAVPVGTIKLSPCELRRSPGKNQLTHIFLRAKIELSGVIRTTVTQYRMELSHVGVLGTPEYRDDIGLFEITDWSRDPIPHDDLRPLPKELVSGNPVEGWVHFVTNWADGRLYESHVRLFADTPNGSGALEVRPGRENWNVVPNRMIIEKSISDIS